MIISLKQRKIKFKKRIKLNHNISVLYEVSGKGELTVDLFSLFFFFVFPMKFM